MFEGSIHELHIQAGEVINIQCKTRIGGDVTLRNSENKTVMDCFQTEGLCHRRNYNVIIIYSYIMKDMLFAFLIQLFDSGSFSCISPDSVSV